MSFPLLVLTSLLMFFGAYYAVFVLSVYRGIGRVRREIPQQSLADAPFVSVVVAAHNEAATISACIESICQQYYPPERYEVIVVDDASTDSTAGEVRRLLERYKQVRLVQLENPVGKPAALTKGIENAKSDLLVLTDADCTVNSHWLDAMVPVLVNGAVLVAGPVIEDQSPRLWRRLSALEYLSLTATAAGLFGIGRPIIASGANLGVRKAAFLAAGGFGTSSPVDDETLLQRMVVRNVGRVSFVLDPAAIVRTKGPRSLREFFQQRTRWATKRGRYEDRSLLALLTLLYLPFFLLMVVGILAILYAVLLVPLLIVWFVKCVVDAMVIARAAKILGVSFSWFDFLVAELLHVPYIVATAPVGQFTSVRWKGRRL